MNLGGEGAQGWIYSESFSALLGVSVWCCGEFAWMTMSITCFKTFSFLFIAYYINDPSCSPVSIFTPFAKLTAQFFPVKRQSVFLSFASELEHMTCFGS